MKTRISPSWVLGLVLVASVPAIVAQETAKSSPAFAPGQAVSTSPVKPYESPWFTELGKLARAGIEDGVMLAFVDSAGTFNLRPEQIIHLRDLGVASDVINAILQHDSEIALGLRQVPASTPPDSFSALEKLLVAGNSSPAATAARPASSTAPKLVEPDASPGPASGASTVAAASPPSRNSIELASSHGEDLALGLTMAEPVQPNALPTELSPVRKPYPEQLTNPIIMVRGVGRVPNLVVIEGFAHSEER
ncbi:MAG TPA: hypothetical protein VNZ64_20760 [Candidatus Acidoferrum sp.]|jgi:hypothetical protein|nr:hypothetical protein [Candidatus Acidoferrum sp.]